MKESKAEAWGVVRTTALFVFASSVALGCRTTVETPIDEPESVESQAVDSSALDSPLEELGDAPVIAQEAATDNEPLTVTFDMRFNRIDEVEADQIENIVSIGRGQVEEFFGGPFLDSIAIDVLPDRAAFSAWFPAEWGVGETACWMVAAGVADALAVLSPRVWTTEACEHDPNDATHVRDIIVHELVHVYHGQHNPTRDFEGAESIGWFLEGLATYASGQLESGHRERAQEAVTTGADPQTLSTAWSGPYRYGVSGTLVEFIDTTFGRDALTEMLAMTHQDELLGLIAMSEAELLAAWKASIQATL